MVTVYNILWWAMSFGGSISKSMVAGNVYLWMRFLINCNRQRLWIDAFLNILRPEMAFDGHRLQSIVVDNVYRWAPSPAYFYFFFCTSYDVLLCCEYQVPIPFSKLRASTKSCLINPPLRTRLSLHYECSSLGHPMAGRSPHTLTKPRASTKTGNTPIRAHLRCHPPTPTTRDPV